MTAEVIDGNALAEKIQQEFAEDGYIVLVLEPLARQDVAVFDLDALAHVASVPLLEIRAKQTEVKPHALHKEPAFDRVSILCLSFAPDVFFNLLELFCGCCYTFLALPDRVWISS